jgi:hypothetical protein
MVPPPCSKEAMRPCFGVRFWSLDGRGGRWSGLAARLFGSGIPCLAYSFKTGLTSGRTLCAVRPGWWSLGRSLGNQPATFQWAASTQWAARTQQAATSRPLRRPGPSGRLGLRPIDGPRRWALPALGRAVPGSRKISLGLARSPGSSALPGAGLRLAGPLAGLRGDASDHACRGIPEPAAASSWHPAGDAAAPTERPQGCCRPEQF